MLKQKLSVEERRIETHHLCTRDSYPESIVPELSAMTAEEAKDYLYHAVHNEEARAFLKNEPKERKRNNALFTRAHLYTLSDVVHSVKSLVGKA